MVESLSQYRERAKVLMAKIEKMLAEFDVNTLIDPPEIDEDKITGFELSTRHGDNGEMEYYGYYSNIEDLIEDLLHLFSKGLVYFKIEKGEN